MMLIQPGPPRSLRVLIGQVIAYGAMSGLGLWHLWRGLSVGRLPLKRTAVGADSPFFAGTGLIWALVLLIIFLFWAEAIATLTTRGWRWRRSKQKTGDCRG